MPLVLSGSTGIVEGNIADSAITTNKIANGAVVAADLAAGAARANFGAGAVLQVVSTTTDAQSSTNSQATALSLSITPSNSTSKILLLVDAQFSMSTDTYGMTRLFRNSTEIASSSQLSTGGSNTRGWKAINHRDGDAQWEVEAVSGTYLDSPSTTSSITYYLKYELNYGTVIYFNRPYDGSNATYHWNSVSTMTLMEIAG